MCKTSDCSMKVFDSADLELALKQWNEIKMKFASPTRELAAKKADNQAASLSSLLHPREGGERRFLSRGRTRHVARSAFGKSPSRTTGSALPEAGDHLTLLQLLALNALDLTAPASNVLLKNRLNNWVQLSGHEGAFAPAGPGTIWKKSSADRAEIAAYEKLRGDALSCAVPRFYKDVEYNGEYFIEMQDLLFGFKNPSVMDIKMGTRTFLESEVANTKARCDLYEKMIKVDPNAPLPEERESKSVTKLRYMQFRENLSSSTDLGFRIDGFKIQGKDPTTDLKLLKSKDEICSIMKQFLNGNEKIRSSIVSKLQNIRSKLEESAFFKSHEVIGSSILIIHDGKRCGAWMIDFAKTSPLPEGQFLDHRSEWCCGNREDGYLTGLDNLIAVISGTGKLKGKR